MFIRQWLHTFLIFCVWETVYFCPTFYVFIMTTLSTFPGMFPFQVMYSQYRGSQGFLLSDLIMQFTRQVLRPKVLLIMLAVTVIMFDLDDLFDLEGIEFEEDEDPQQPEGDDHPPSDLWPNLLGFFQLPIYSPFHFHMYSVSTCLSYLVLLPLTLSPITLALNLILGHYPAVSRFPLNPYSIAIHSYSLVYSIYSQLVQTATHIAVFQNDMHGWLA